MGNSFNEIDRRYAANAHVHKFGANAAIGTTAEDIWDGGGTYAYPSAANTVSVASGDAADAGGGTGARTVQLYGLDADYKMVNETLTMNGVTPVVSTQSYLRVYRMIVRSAGSGGSNAGVITATHADTAATCALISVGNNQTLMAQYTIPAGFTGWMTHLVAGSADFNSGWEVRLWARPEGEPWQLKLLHYGLSGLVLYPLVTPVAYAEKTDLRTTGRMSSGAEAFSASFELLLDK